MPFFYGKMINKVKAVINYCKNLGELQWHKRIEEQ